MELSDDQNTELEQSLLRLVESYNKVSRASSDMGWVFLRMVVVGLFLIIGLSIELVAYEDTRVNYIYSGSLMAVGALLVLIGVSSWRKKKKIVSLEMRTISDIENDVKEKYNLEYCECNYGQHLYSPEKKKIWNENEHFLFGEHSTERKVPFIWN